MYSFIHSFIHIQYSTADHPVIANTNFETFCFLLVIKVIAIFRFGWDVTSYGKPSFTSKDYLQMCLHNTFCFFITACIILHYNSSWPLRPHLMVLCEFKKASLSQDSVLSSAGNSTKYPGLWSRWWWWWPWSCTLHLAFVLVCLPHWISVLGQGLCLFYFSILQGLAQCLICGMHAKYICWMNKRSL